MLGQVDWSTQLREHPCEKAFSPWSDFDQALIRHWPNVRKTDHRQQFIGPLISAWSDIFARDTDGKFIFQMSPKCFKKEKKSDVCLPWSLCAARQHRTQEVENATLEIWSGVPRNVEDKCLKSHDDDERIGVRSRKACCSAEWRGSRGRMEDCAAKAAQLPFPSPVWSRRSPASLRFGALRGASRCVAALARPPPLPLKADGARVRRLATTRPRRPRLQSRTRLPRAFAAASSLVLSYQGVCSLSELQCVWYVCFCVLFEWTVCVFTRFARWAR